MCRFPASGSSRESFAHSGVTMTPSVTRWSRNALANSAIRCRFVNRFARPKVLSHVARQRFSPRDAPLSSIGSRRDQFSDVISTMRALRLPTHASPVTYLFRFRGPRDSSSVRARRCQRSRAGGGPATGQDHCSAGDLKLPAHLTWTRVGPLRFPDDPSCASAPFQDCQSACKFDPWWAPNFDPSSDGAGAVTRFVSIATPPILLFDRHHPSVPTCA